MSSGSSLHMKPLRLMAWSLLRSVAGTHGSYASAYNIYLLAVEYGHRDRYGRVPEPPARQTKIGAWF